MPNNTNFRKHEKVWPVGIQALSSSVFHSQLVVRKNTEELRLTSVLCPHSNLLNGLRENTVCSNVSAALNSELDPHVTTLRAFLFNSFREYLQDAGGICRKYWAAAINTISYNRVVNLKCVSFSLPPRRGRIAETKTSYFLTFPPSTSSG